MWMNIVKKLLGIFVAVILFSGCTTLTDFQKMGNWQRANFVCSEHAGIKQLESNAAWYQEEANKIQAVLSTGYRVHESCQKVKVERPGTTDCITYGPLTTCTPTTITTYENQCTQTPVPINYQEERAKYDQFLSASQSALNQRKQLYSECHDRVRKMSPEEAYGYYEREHKL
jgi:hypothetical protein